MYKYSATCLIAAATLTMHSAQAIPRKDVLECGLADGSRFVLTSTYDWFAVPLPMRGNTRESRRASWSPEYFDKRGVRSDVPTSVMYANKYRETLEETCAYFGIRDGVPLAPYTYLRDNGAWSSKDDFPWLRLSLELIDPDSELSNDARALRKAGIQHTPYQFAYIRPLGRRLVFEKPLNRTLAGTLYTIPFDAVYQAFSDDGGRTWSEGHITDQALIFEMGRSWIEQSFRARPLRLNGKPFDKLKE